MNYRKQLRKMNACRNDNSARIGIALIGGLALGAVLALLFAPKKGKELRHGIADARHRFNGTFTELMDALKEKFGAGTADLAEREHEEETHYPRGRVKKPKSDIGELIHEAHKSGQNQQGSSPT